MFYESITQDQVTATRALLKLLRFLRVCGVLEVDVTSNSKTYPSERSWTYCMKVVKYHPGVYRLPMDMADQAMQDLVKFSEDLGLYDDF